MIIDTHVHLYHKRFNDDREEVIARAHEKDVRMMVMPAIDVPSISDAIALCEAHEGLYAMSAIHPSDVKDATDEDLIAVRQFCENEHVIAVGESGLDYYWDRSFDAKQHEYFRQHIRLAIEHDLPLVIHNREATADVLRILTEERDAAKTPEKMRGILHCFGGPVEVIDEVMGLGYLFGIGGTVTFKNSGVADVVRAIPIDHIVVETDAPFLAPVPHRGKRNEPAYTRLVVEKIAEVKQLSVEEVEALTTANALRIFGLDTV